MSNINNSKNNKGRQWVALMGIPILLAWNHVLAQTYTTEYVIVSGGCGIMAGYIAPAIQGEERQAGTLSMLVGQPFVSTSVMSGGDLRTELGFWTTRLRTPGVPFMTATWDIFPNKIDLTWRFDPNIPPSTLFNRIYRDGTLIRDNYQVSSLTYSDESQSLNVGTEYTYELKGKNVFGFAKTNGLVIGKTATVGSVAGIVSTTLGTKIPNAKLVLLPNWGYSLFLDGTDDYVTIPDGNEFELADNTALTNATVEFWVKPQNTGTGTQAILAKGTAWQLRFNSSKISFTRSGTEILLSDNIVAVDNWVHIALVKTSGTLRLYLNGVPVFVNGGQSSVTLSNLAGGSDQLYIGKTASGNFLRANLDDLRFWNSARTETDIARDYNRYLYYRTLGTVNYTDLTAIYNFDAGTGSIISNAVNQARNGTITGLSASTWSTSKPEVYATAYTDPQGTYQINNINYGSGTNFTLTPSKPYHNFDPVYRLVYLSSNSPVANNQNFSVTNLMSITGYVYYDPVNTVNVQCGEKQVQILVNGKSTGVLTNNEGFYRVEVEPGANVTVQPYKASRDTLLDFTPRKEVFTNVVTNKTANFIDTKTRNLRGSVTGGVCGYPLGPVGLLRVEVKPTTGLFTKEVAVDAVGNYAFPNLPPQAYQISVKTNVAGTYSPPVPNLIVMDQFFNNSGKTLNTESSFSMADSAWKTTEDQIDFVYRSPILTSISDFKKNVLGHNCYTQNVPDSLEFFAYEQYWNSQQCPVDSGNFKIFDYISDRWTPDSEQDTVVVSFGTDGRLRYGVVPGKPNISGSDTQPPYRKKIEIIAEDQLGRRASALGWAVVLGNVPQQMDFTTVAPDIPFLILRRPPGDQSVSTFSHGQTASSEFEISMGTSMGLEEELSANLGTKFTTEIGLGVSTEMSVEAKYELTENFSTTFSLAGSYAQNVSISTEAGYTTGTGVDVAGGFGDLDVFVGGGLNLLYGNTKVLRIKTDNSNVPYYNVEDQIVFVPDGFATTFIYTRKYIKEILIPELRFLSQADTTKLEDIRRWEQVLAREDSLRWVTEDTVNYSFEGGVGAFSQSRTSEVTDTYKFNVNLAIDYSIAEKVGFTINEGFGMGDQIKYKFGFNIGAGTTTTKTNRSTSSFSLDDDDFGDDYSVSVGSDPVYGTPVFHLIAGHSSCPYEEWKNQQGTVVSIPRDVPYMEVQGPSEINNVLPTDPAELTLLLRNDNYEERTYFLSFVQASNPHGAIVEINGNIYTGPIEYTLPPREGRFAQVRVWRASGDIYEYQNLMVKFAPQCESNYAGVTIGFTVPFTVNFARPCTPASIYEPAPNWVLNTLNYDTLNIVATGYDLRQSYFEELWLQFRALGDESWTKVNTATLIADTLTKYNQVAALMRWPVNDLIDGVYDLRLRSMCLEGLLTNEMPPLRGTIDRMRPTVLGAPEPVDAVLNMNDEIAVNFTETINPATVLSSNVVLFDGEGGGRITNLNVSVSENRLVITPMVSNYTIENHYLEAIIYGYKDMFGNPGDTVSWTFQVNRNPISWNQPVVEAVAITGENNGFELNLNNIGSNAKPFQIINHSGRLTASPAEGEINPGGSFKIHFDIDPNLNVGEFEEFIYAETPDGREPLRIKVVSMCPYPDWTFNPSDYQFTMNVTARLSIKGTASGDKYDRLGAFVNGVCRGYVNLQYMPTIDKYLALLTIYSNQAGGEIVDFHIWDRTDCAEYWEIDTLIVFTSDTYIGTPDSPARLNANGAISQNFSLNKGFTWFSVNLNNRYASKLDSVFSGLSLAGGDRIIGQEGYGQYSAQSHKWEGTLAQTGLALGKMYMSDFYVANPLHFIGYKIFADTCQVKIFSGWNWLGYLPDRTIAVKDALKDLKSSTNDLIKDQYSFAQYTTAYGWIGNLSYMIPGRGYKLKSGKADTLSYPAVDLSAPAVPLLAKSAAKSIPLPESPWTCNSSTYANSMSLTALIVSDTLGINDPCDAVAAFCGKEVRGVARPIYIPQLNAYRIFMVIYGKESDQISFQIYDSDCDITYRGVETLAFRADDITGDPLNPLMLTKQPLRPGDKGYIPEVYSLSQNYPNPFNPTTTFAFGLPEDNRVSIVIYNLIGQRVTTLINTKLPAGYRYVQWNSRDDNGLIVPSGMYFAVMESGSFRQMRKIMLMK